MNLAPMRFKNFVWPYNPQVYSITYERKMAVNKIPFGRHCLQSLGQTRRVFKGVGEFTGPEAYDTFKQLASVFYEETPGPLVHPVWMAVSAWFVGLRLEQEPRSDYVRYSFEFWEVIPGGRTGLQRETKTTPPLRNAKKETPALWHSVTAGETLWGLAQRYGVAVASILKKNPEIRNPSLIFPGQKVRIR